MQMDADCRLLQTAPLLQAMGMGPGDEATARWPTHPRTLGGPSWPIVAHGCRLQTGCTAALQNQQRPPRRRPASAGQHTLSAPRLLHRCTAAPRVHIVTARRRAAGSLHPRQTTRAGCWESTVGLTARNNTMPAPVAVAAAAAAAATRAPSTV